MDSFVKFIGKLHDGTEVTHQFMARHDDAEILFDFMNKEMNRISFMGGMMSLKDEHQKSDRDYNNMIFTPIHRIHHIEFQVKSLATEIPDYETGIRH